MGFKMKDSDWYKFGFARGILTAMQAMWISNNWSQEEKEEWERRTWNEYLDRDWETEFIPI